VNPLAKFETLAKCEPPGQAPAPPQEPGKNAKNAPPAPRFAGPAPAATTLDPDAVGQYPGGSRSEDDPCLGLRALRTGGAFGFFIIRYRCDKVNTLVGDPAGFFCHSRDFYSLDQIFGRGGRRGGGV